LYDRKIKGKQFSIKMKEIFRKKFVRHQNDFFRIIRKKQDSLGIRYIELAAKLVFLLKK
jgi:hypothetical protein